MVDPASMPTTRFLEDSLGAAARSQATSAPQHFENPVHRFRTSTSGAERGSVLHSDGSDITLDAGLGLARGGAPAAGRPRGTLADVPEHSRAESEAGREETEEERGGSSPLARSGVPREIDPLLEALLQIRDGQMELRRLLENGSG